MIIKHTLTKWGVSLSDYQLGGWGTAVGNFRVPKSIINRFRIKYINYNNTNYIYDETKYIIETNNNNTNWDKSKFILNSGKVWEYSNSLWNSLGSYLNQEAFDAERAFNEIATTYMQAIVSQYDILRNIEFELLLDGTKDYIKKALYNAIEFSSLNKQFWENVNGSNVSTPGFNISIDQTNWLLTSDMMGMKSWNYLTNSELSEYNIIGDTELSQLVYIESDGATVLHTFNNIEFGKLLIDKKYKTIKDTITHITSADKYDYVVVNGDNGLETWRFEGGDYTLDSNWDRKDIKTINGNRYLIFKNFILAGSQGKQGIPGSALSKEDKSKIDNLPPDTYAALSNLQSDMGFSYIGMDRTRVILDGKHLSAYNLHGDTQTPTADDHLTNKGYVDEEIQKIKIKWLSAWYPSVQAFIDRADNYEIVKSDIDKDGHNVPSGIILLVKVGSDVKQFWTMEAAQAYVQSQLLLLQQDISVNANDITTLKQNVTSISNEQHGLRHRMDAMDTTVGGKADKTDSISLSDGWAEEQVKIIKIDGHWKNISQTLHSFADGAKVRIWHAGNESYTGYLTKSSNTHNLLIAANDFSHGPSFIGWDSAKNPDHLSLIIFNKAPNQDTYTIMENQIAITKFEVWEEPVYEYKAVLVKAAGNPIGLGGKP